jgi:hypothetical protein
MDGPVSTRFMVITASDPQSGHPIGPRTDSTCTVVTSPGSNSRKVTSSKPTIQASARVGSVITRVFHLKSSNNLRLVDPRYFFVDPVAGAGPR